MIKSSCTNAIQANKNRGETLFSTAFNTLGEDAASPIPPIPLYPAISQQKQTTKTTTNNKQQQYGLRRKSSRLRLTPRV